MKDYREIRKSVEKKYDSLLSEFACKNSDAIRIGEDSDEIRPPFSIDRDRIMYSGAYKRLAGKTQVIYFSSLLDEQITNRIVHIQYVAQVARTIGKALSLNQDLIEAAALGHDLGHTPFGHDGEKYLDRLCKDYGIGGFSHNVHSLYIVEKMSYKGKGMNLTLQTRDAIVSHNGEIDEDRLASDPDKTESDVLKYLDRKFIPDPLDVPMTLEGCVIRMSDTIAYIGTDIEDAIHLGLLSRSDIPQNVSNILGKNNSSIIDTLVKDIIVNSWNKNHLEFSKKTADALRELKQFNYRAIYLNDKLKPERRKIEKGFNILFESFSEDIETGNRNSDIYRHFLDQKNEEYMSRTKNAEKVRDFIASMTDRYFKYQLEKITIPLVNL
ncbi:MAG: dGTP triphosphohydrolase [Candidatus Delongbacteria bacterium GWF2_40_14]|nr:MAG: dGTP triphosphohydrolase [Candidatus Delongbacteria bacterium GWF2_40_14]